MAARRLLILMLVLLGVSTLAAALVPPQAEREETATETATEATRPEAARRPPGRLVRATIETSRRRPQTIRLRRGDELSLVVRSRAPDQAGIPAFGLLEDVGRDDPARFDLLPERTGSFEIRLVEAGRVIGRIAVRPKGRSGKRERPRERER